MSQSDKDYLTRMEHGGAPLKEARAFTHEEAIAHIKKMNYAEAVEPYAAAIRMVRDAIEEMFGPVASLESAEAVLLRGPEPHHDAEAIIAALQRVKETYEYYREVSPDE